MTVQQGMDVERVRQIADQLGRSGDTLANIGSTGQGQLSVLGGAWSGPDLEHFSREWSGAEKALSEASSAVRSLSEQLRTQAGEQEGASRADGSVLAGGVGGGPAAGGSPGGAGGGSQLPPWLHDARTVTGLLGHASTANNIAKLVNGGRGMGSLLGSVPALSRPVMSVGTRLGLFMDATLLHPGLGRATGRLFSNPHVANFLNTSRAGAMGTLFSRTLGPLGVGFGAYDVVTGIRDGDASQIVSGGLGVASVAVPLLMATGPAGWAVGAGLALGSFVASQWGDEIGSAATTAWNWTGDRLSDFGDAAGDIAGDVAEDVGSVLNDPVGAIGGLFS